MSIMKWIMILEGIVAIVFGLYVFGIGLWGLAKKRPLIFAARQLMWFLLAMFIPIIILFYVPLFEPWRHSDPFYILMPIIETALLALLIFINWRQMTGYMIFGVSDETFHDGLISALNKLHLPFEESISKVKLIGLGIDLHAVVSSWMGTAQIRIKQRQNAKYAKDIANAMNEYYKGHAIKVNNTTFVLYLLLGILMIIFVFVFWRYLG